MLSPLQEQVAEIIAGKRNPENAVARARGLVASLRSAW